jgi:hypothetical protein
VHLIPPEECHDCRRTAEAAIPTIPAINPTPRPKKGNDSALPDAMFRVGEIIRDVFIVAGFLAIWLAGFMAADRGEVGVVAGAFGLLFILGVFTLIQIGRTLREILTAIKAGQESDRTN